MDVIGFLEERRNAEVQNRFKLNKLGRDFYRKVAEEIKKLENERTVLFKQGDYSGGTKKTLEIERAKRFFSEIVQMRIRKILKYIMGTKKPENMTPEEEAFYNQLQMSVNMFINTLLEGGSEEPIKKKENVDEERKVNYVLVRVSVPLFKLALPNRDLILKKEDVLYLPEKFFRILVGKDIVKEIKLER